MIDYLRSRPYALAEMSRLSQGHHALFLTPHVLYEVYRGVSRAPRAESRIERIRQTVGTLPFERHAAREAARIGEALRREGQDIPLGDLLIAASTIVWGDCEIITRDVRHFRRLAGFGLRIRPISTG